MAEATDPQPPGRGKLVALTVILTTLFWTVVWGGFMLARGRPQPVAFAVQPPPATATPAPTATPVATVENTATATPATGSSRTGFVVLDASKEDSPPASPTEDASLAATAPITGSSPANSASAILVNINTATLAELDLLPGIGPKTAEAIIAYRDEHGPFVTIEAITEVKGIGPATLENLRVLITTE